MDEGKSSKMKSMQKESIVQFIKFSLVGLSNTVLGLGLYYLFLYLGMNYLLSNFLSWAISVFNAFYWNNKYVFATGNKWLPTLVRTYISYAFSLVLSTVLLYVFVEFIEISSKIAPLLVLVITVPVNFILNKFWAFKERR